MNLSTIINKNVFESKVGTLLYHDNPFIRIQQLCDNELHISSTKYGFSNALIRCDNENEYRLQAIALPTSPFSIFRNDLRHIRYIEKNPIGISIFIYTCDVHDDDNVVHDENNNIQHSLAYKHYSDEDEYDVISEEEDNHSERKNVKKKWCFYSIDHDIDNTYLTSLLLPFMNHIQLLNPHMSYVVTFQYPEQQPNLSVPLLYIRQAFVMNEKMNAVFIDIRKSDLTRRIHNFNQKSLIPCILRIPTLIQVKRLSMIYEIINICNVHSNINGITIYHWDQDKIEHTHTIRNPLISSSCCNDDNVHVYCCSK